MSFNVTHNTNIVNFTIIIDTREQKPFLFRGVDTEIKKLDTGDYSVSGLEDRICVERKTINDFVGTVTRGWSRFERELERMSKMESTCIVVEGSLEDITCQRYHAPRVSPPSIWGSALKITVKYNVPVFFCGSRRAAERWALGWLRMQNEKIQKNI